MSNRPVDPEPLFPEMDDDERRRWLDGRADWQTDQWEDHCGDPECGHSECDRNYIPHGPHSVIEARRILTERLGL